MIAVGLTDLNWFTLLRSGPPHGEVNFWTPTPWGVSALGPGDHWYFLLKAPIRKIGGYGEFRSYEDMTTSQAWRHFGPGNGVTDMQALLGQMRIYLGKHTSHDLTTPDPVIGAIVLSNPVFFDDADFFAPEDRGAPVARQVVKFKTFPDLTTLEPQATPEATAPAFELVDPATAVRRVGLAPMRPFQQAFRNGVLAAYGRACAITGESCVEVLEAAHIQPYLDRRSNDVRNGILLRTDLHGLFDAGFFTISEQLRVVISPRLQSKTYRSLDGMPVRLPARAADHPSPVALRFHRESVFRAA